MNARTRARYKKQLQALLSELMEKSDETINGMENQRADFADPADRASFESSRHRELRIRERELNLIFKIKSALKRIDEGTFGICEECGGPIDAKRLRARPVTTMCIDCKTAQEEMEKRGGA